VRVELDDDSDCPGFRETGVRKVRDSARITDDLRCRRCGAEAQVTLLMELKDEVAEDQPDYLC